MADPIDRVYHAAPHKLASVDHWMGAAAAALAGIPSAGNHQLQPILLGAELDIVNGELVFTGAPGGPFVHITGDTMTGPLILSGDPAVALEAATKQYVDAADAILAAGIATLDSEKVDRAGDTMTGRLVIAPTAAAANDALAIVQNSHASAWAQTWYTNDLADFLSLTMESVGATWNVPTGDIHRWSVGGTERLRLDANGNLGLALTPSAWSTSYKALEIGFSGNGIWSATGNNNLWLSSGWYYDGTNWKYTVTGAPPIAVNIGAANGWFAVYTAANGTSGNNASPVQELSITRGGTLALTSASSQAGTGITFPAAQYNASNVNSLDDYEEGTFNVSDASGAGVAVSGTMYYVKIGRMVTVSGTVGVPATGSTNQVVLGGCPFTSVSGNWSGGSAIPFTSTGIDCSFMVPGGSNLLYAYDPDAAAARLWNTVSGATLYSITVTFQTP